MPGPAATLCTRRMGLRPGIGPPAESAHRFEAAHRVEPADQVERAHRVEPADQVNRGNRS